MTRTTADAAQTAMKTTATRMARRRRSWRGSLGASGAATSASTPTSALTRRSVVTPQPRRITALLQNRIAVIQPRQINPFVSCTGSQLFACCPDVLPKKACLLHVAYCLQRPYRCAHQLAGCFAQEGALRSRSSRKGARKDRKKQKRRRLALAAGAWGLYSLSHPQPRRLDCTRCHGWLKML